MSLDSFVIPFQVASIEKGYTFVVRGFEGKGKKISLYASDNKNANILLENYFGCF